MALAYDDYDDHARVPRYNRDMRSRKYRLVTTLGQGDRPHDSLVPRP